MKVEMKHLFVVLTVCAMLTGCKLENNLEGHGRDFNSSDFEVLCLNGVEYYARSAGNKGYMSVRIDSETLLPARCEK